MAMDYCHVCGTRGVPLPVSLDPNRRDGRGVIRACSLGCLRTLYDADEMASGGLWTLTVTDVAAAVADVLRHMPLRSVGPVYGEWVDELARRAGVASDAAVAVLLCRRPDIERAAGIAVASVEQRESPYGFRAPMLRFRYTRQPVPRPQGDA